MKIFTTLFFSLFLGVIGFGQMTEVFTTSGSWTVPAGVFEVNVEVWGAGGGGGGSNSNNNRGSGGGGGAYAQLNGISVTPGQNIPFTVGVGGNGGVANGGAGQAGGSTTFLSLVANGGNGGGGNNGAVGVGGTASGGSTNVNGAAGQQGNSGGRGGNGANGGNGGNGNTDGAGFPGNVIGGGGGGGERYSHWFWADVNYPGGNGARGQLVITYCVQPSIDPIADIEICTGDNAQLIANAAYPTNVATIGTATANDLVYPFNTYWEDARSQYILLASELEAAGMVAGNITSIAYRVNSRNGAAMNNFNINLGNTALTTLAGYQVGLTNVYAGTYTVPATGWQTIVFQNPFYWDGTSNLIVETCFDNNSWTDWSTVDYRDVAGNRLAFQVVDGGAGCSLNAPNLAARVPIVRFGFDAEVTYSWAPSGTLNNSSIPNPIATPASTTAYTVTASTSNCSADQIVTITVNTPPGDPTIFGNNQWNVYAYNGDNANWALNTYRGYYIQPALSATNYGVNTLSFWGNNGSPSEAGAPLGSGNLWNGCDVTPNNHAVIHKRRGFPCGLYEFTMNSWDDPAEVIINGVTVWSCTAWSGSGTCPTGSIGTYSLDAASEVEVRYREFTGGSNVSLDIIAVSPTQLALDGSTRTCEVNGGVTYVNFVDNTGRLIASVNPQGNNLGNVTMTSYVQTAPFQVDACPDPQPQFNTAVLGRRWVITPTTQPTSPVRVRLYFHANEYNALEPVANANPNSSDNTVGFFDLSLSKYHNSVNPSLVNNSPFDNCPSGSTTIHAPQAGNNANALFVGFDANGLYTEYEIPNFSEFWLHGSSIDSPLPVTLTSFNANCEDNGVRVSWSTASELNADYFDVERSRDGVYWETINTQDAAGTTNQAQEYSFMDTFLGGTTVYYRLRQVDNDGKEELYGPVAASCESNSYAMTVFPNPATNSFTVQVYAESTVNDAQLVIYDFTGKAIVQQAIEVNNGVQTYHFNDAGLARGTYIVRIQDNEGKFTPVKLVIQ